MYSTNPEAFADLFNEKVQGAYRKVTGYDIRSMTKCGLIGRCGFYVRQDLETVRGILEYELSRDHQSDKGDQEKNTLICKRCGKTFNPNPESKPGRPPEYCTDCEAHRNRERQKLSRDRRRKLNLKRNVGNHKS